MKYRLLTAALLVMREAAEFYEGRVVGLGGDFIMEVESAISRILQFPDAWGRISANYRHCPLRRFPYSLVYTRESEGGLLIISVFHQSREPRSWKRNL